MTGSTTTFLLGSGISMKAGMKGTHDITENICQGDSKHQMETEFTSFIRQKYYECNGLEKRESINYEDIYYTIDSLCNESYEAKHDPAVVMFKSAIMPTALLIVDKHPKYNCPAFNTNILKPSEKANKLFEDTKCYILDKVAASLSVNNIDVGYLDNFLLNGVTSCQNSQKIVNVFSLNHDLVLETFFENNKLKINDGFEKTENGFSKWNWDSFTQQNADIRFYKLHGSISWHEIRNKCIVNRIEKDFEVLRKNGFWAESQPFVLTGTRNKAEKYTHSIYYDLQLSFSRALLNTNILVVAGFSFGDDIITTKIIEWFSSNDTNKLVIIDKPSEDKDEKNWNTIKYNLRPTIGGHWDKFVSESRIIPIKKAIEDLYWKNVEGLLK
jgi:SIR2-like domain